MISPEWMQVGINVGTFVLLLFLLPQAVGLVLLHRWWNRGWKVRIVVALLPAVLCFVISLAYWNVTAARITEAGRYPCGLLGAAAWWTTQMASLLNVAVGFAVLLVMIARRRRTDSRRQHAAC